MQNEKRRRPCERSACSQKSHVIFCSPSLKSLGEAKVENGKILPWVHLHLGGLHEERGAPPYAEEGKSQPGFHAPWPIAFAWKKLQTELADFPRVKARRCPVRHLGVLPGFDQPARKRQSPTQTGRLWLQRCFHFPPTNALCTQKTKLNHTVNGS